MPPVDLGRLLRSLALVLLAAGMVLILAGVLLLASCAPRPRVTGSLPSNPRHCFSAEVRTRDGSSERARVCWSRREACAYVFGMAVARGGQVGVTQLTKCEENK